MKTLMLLLLCGSSVFGLTLQERLLYAVDVGERYHGVGGVVEELHRLPGSVFIRADNIYVKPTLVESLRRPGGLLEGWTYEETGWPLVFFMRAPLEIVEQQNAQPELLQNLLDALRDAPHVHLANPVHISPRTAYEMVVLDELNISLRPETLPSVYFGADLPASGPLFPEVFEHVLRRPGASAEAILAEANERHGNPWIRWVEPNFLIEARQCVVPSPNDPVFQNGDPNFSQWAWFPGPGMRIDTAWDRTLGQGITIAVLDSGSEYNHDDSCRKRHNERHPRNKRG